MYIENPNNHAAELLIFSTVWSFVYISRCQTEGFSRGKNLEVDKKKLW